MYEFKEKKSKLGRRLYFVVLAVFLVFAVSFIIFQQAREKQFKISTLTLKLSNYNALLEEDLSLAHDKGIILSDSSGKAVDVARDKLNVFIREHESKDLRITLIRPNGKVVYDNMRNDFDHFSNHINRKEIQEALRTGLGSSVERQS